MMANKRNDDDKENVVFPDFDPAATAMLNNPEFKKMAGQVRYSGIRKERCDYISVAENVRKDETIMNCITSLKKTQGQKHLADMSFERKHNPTTNCLTIDVFFYIVMLSQLDKKLFEDAVRSSDNFVMTADNTGEQVH